eukprot:5744965-Amphidinium_carterae.1
MRFAKSASPQICRPSTCTFDRLVRRVCIVLTSRTFAQLMGKKGEAALPLVAYACTCAFSLMQPCRSRAWRKTETMSTWRELNPEFSQGESALSMYFVILGKIQYSRQDVEVVVYEAKTWVCEVALWTPWVHQGEMVALMDSELLSLHSGTFREVMAQHH